MLQQVGSITFASPSGKANSSPLYIGVLHNPIAILLTDVILAPAAKAYHQERRRALTLLPYLQSFLCEKA